MVTPYKFRREYAFHWHLPDNWHIKKLDDSVIEGSARPLRYPLTGRSKGLMGNCTVGLWIMIPNSCLRPASEPDSPRTHTPQQWLPVPAAEAGAIELAVALCPMEALGNGDWPRMPEAFGPRVTIQAWFPAPHDCVVVLAWHPLDEMPPDIQAGFNRLPKSGIVLDSPERRGIVAWPSANGGTLHLWEHAID